MTRRQPDWALVTRTAVGRWSLYYHSDGKRQNFRTLGAARRFVRQHSLDAIARMGAFNEVTKEIVAIV